MLIRLISPSLGLSLLVAACVAPEAPAPPKPAPPAAAMAPSSSAQFEDAPVPNRKMGGPTGDAVIRMQ